MAYKNKIEKTLIEKTAKLNIEKFSKILELESINGLKMVEEFLANLTTNCKFIAEVVETAEGKVLEITSPLPNIVNEVASLRHSKETVETVNAELDNVMEGSLDMICVLKRDTSVIRVSAASEIILGYKPEELVGKIMLDYVYKEDLERTLIKAQELVEGNTTNNFCNRYVHKDGSIVSLEWAVKWDDKVKLYFALARDVTSKIEAELNLKKSEKRFKSLIQDASDMIAIIDAEGYFKYVSPTSFTILGYSQNEFEKGNVFDFIHPDDIPFLQDHILLLDKNKKMAIPHFRFRDKAGVWRWFETILTNLIEQPGVRGIVANCRDITERRKIEEELIITNQRYENVTDATFDAIWEWDLITDDVYWGKGYEVLFGFKNENNISNASVWRDHLHLADKERILKGIALIIADKNANNWTAEYRYLKEDGEYSFVLDKGIVVRDKNGKGIRMIGAMQDITKRKQEEHHLKLMSSVVTNTTDAILITEAEPSNIPGHRIIYVNNAFTEMTGYTEDEVLGKTPRILQGPKTDKNELTRMSEAIKRWNSCEINVINYKKNGDEFWNNFTISPVADETGNYTHWIAVETDVTEIKNEELQKNLLSEIRNIFNKPITLNETLKTVLEKIALFGNFCLAESWLTTDKNEIERVTYHVEDSQMRDVLTKHSKIFIQTKGEGLVGTAWQTKKLQKWEKGSKTNNIVDKDILLKVGIKKAYALPFLFNTEVVGVLLFGLINQEKSLIKIEKLFNILKEYLGAEIKRKQQEQELNQLFNFAPDIIATIGMDNYFKKINPAGLALLEYTEAELMASPVTAFIHQDDRKKNFEELTKLSHGTPIMYYENRYITKSGKTKWLASSAVLSKENGLIFSVAKDITEKKELEVMLDKANVLAKIGTWELNIEKNKFYLSDIVKEMIEAPKDFEPNFDDGMNMYKEGTNRDLIISTVNNTILNNVPWDLELQLITKNGNEKWVRAIGQAEFENGVCIKLYGSVQDIDQRKRNEEQIRSSEERRELIMTSALDAIICIDKLGIVTFWNPQAVNIFGWNEAEVMGKQLSNLIIPKQYRTFHNAGMENYFKKGKGPILNKLIQLVATKKSGEEFPIELTILPIQQEGDEFFCAFIRDITERKRSETRLIELNHSLQKQAQALAISNQELEQFAYMASHDLQEPLRMVSSFLTQLEKKYEPLLDERGKKYIHLAVDGAKRMRQIILDLLEFSRIGRVEELKQMIDLEEIAHEIKILYSSNIIEQNAEITTNNLPKILSYKAPIRQVFQNLISNALKYCKTGIPSKINISSIDKGSHWQFSVEDNGIGINKEYFDKIFIIFQRLHNQEVYSGIGMGLAATKKIIETLGGNIWLESEEAKGSTFYFSLPK